MRILAKLQQRGDTIVEVLIVLAVLGLAFSISSATASRGLAQSRNAEEHSQALGIMSSQLEYMRAASNADTDVYGFSRSFCMNGNVPVVFAGTVPGSANADSLQVGTNPGQYPAACNSSNGLYFQSITYDNANGSFQFRTRWQGANGLGAQEESFVYRIRPLTADVTTGVDVAATPGQITVKVLPTRPNSYQADPSCSDPSPAVARGAGVNLRQTNGSYDTNQATGGAALTIFDNLTQGGIYHVNVYSAPPMFDNCPPVVSNPDYTITAATPSYTFQTTMVPHGWWRNGISYDSCAQGESYPNDGHNGCNPRADPAPNGTSEYSRRNVNFAYNLPSGMSFAGKACLRIQYQQYKLGNTLPPPDYSAYSLTAKLIGSSTTSQVISLPIARADAYSTRQSGCQQVDIPNGANKLELDWTNNTGSGVSTSTGDPDLQIDSVQLFYIDQP